MLRKRPRILLTAVIVATAVSVALAGCTAASGPGSTASAAPKPTSGGSIAIGGLATSALDPGQLGYSTQSQAYTDQIFGSLFLPPLKTGDKVRPGVATGYKYNSDNTQLTLTLRSGAKYQDGTPVDADSVVWNLKRWGAPGMTSAQYFTEVSSIVADGTDKVVISFDKPFTLLIDAFAYTPAGYLGSETAFNKLGADGFNTAPVGAGPFKVDTVQPGQELDLVKADTYWDAKHVYLAKVSWINSGNDPQSSLVKLQSGAIQSVTFATTNTSPEVLKQGEQDPSLTELRTASTGYAILPVNTFAAPFNDLKARQAISYCMDRESIAKNAMQGYATPSYVISGDSDYLTKWQDGKGLNPYQFSVSKGKKLVTELGGLSFDIVTNADSPILDALQQQWSTCGITAKIDIRSDYLNQVQAGTYQMSFTVASQRTYNPAMTTAYQDPTTANDKFGFNDSQVTSGINEAKGLVEGAQAKALWVKVWKRVAELAVSIPVVASPRFVFSTKCLQGVDTAGNSAGGYVNAYLTC